MTYSWEDIEALMEYWKEERPEAREAVRDIGNALWNNPECGGYRKAVLEAGQRREDISYGNS